jgi:hypothetical protein
LAELAKLKAAKERGKRDGIELGKLEAEHELLKKKQV